MEKPETFYGSHIQIDVSCKFLFFFFFVSNNSLKQNAQVCDLASSFTLAG